MINETKCEKCQDQGYYLKKDTLSEEIKVYACKCEAGSNYKKMIRDFYKDDIPAQIIL